MMRKIDLSNRGLSKRTAPILIVALALIVLGAYPDKNMFWMKCRIAEWVIISIVCLTFIKGRWLQTFLLFSLFRVIINFNFASFNAYYYIFLFFIAYQIMQNVIHKKDMTLIVNGFCIIMLMQLIYMYLQYFGIDPFFAKGVIGKSTNVQHYVVATWSHTNLSAASLAMTLPLFFRRKWCIFILPIIVMLFFARSLAAIIAAACGIVFFAMFRSKKIKIALVISMLLIVTLYGMNFDRRQFLRTDRFQYWRPTIKIALVRPFIGWGLGQYKIAFHAINRDAFKSTMLRGHAHFEAMELFLEEGLIGVALLLAWLITIFVIFFKSHNALSIAAMSGLVASLVNSCATFAYRTPLAWMALILILIVKKEAQENENTLHWA